MKKLSLTGALMASAALIPHSVHAQAVEKPRQQSAPQSLTAGDDEEIVVEGQKLRGSVAGDFTPELTMNPGDVRALGVSDISELVSELAPQLTSGRGGQPVVLLEGRRVSSFREIATIPTEAIQRVEILPEEVALKFGYPADQKVMNIILRRRFRAFTLEAKDRLATDGGANQPNGELGFLSIRKNGRLNLNAEYQRTAALMESARGIVNPTTGADTLRTAIPSDKQLTITATLAKPLATWLNSSLNVELMTDQTAALTGPPTIPSVTIAPGTPYSTSATATNFTPVLDQSHPLQRSNSEQSIRLGTTLNADGKAWRGTLTTTYLHDEARTISARGYDVSAYQAAITAGDPLANPALPTVAPGFAILSPSDVARSRSDLATADLIMNGNLYRMPAGEVSLTVHVAGTYNGFESESTRLNTFTSASLDRSIGLGGLSIDVPLIKSLSPFIGKLSANGNVEAQSLSDFGTINAYGFGLNWRPRTGVALIASFKGAETAPTVQQLGNPTITTANVQVFDYQTGKTVNITQISGGNRNLLAADQDSMRLGLTLKPFGSKPDLTFSLDYNRSVAHNGVGSLPGTTDAAEAAFSNRFQRDGAGDLVSIDTRSINIERRETSSIRWGLNFTKTLKTPQSQIDAMRKAQAARFPNGMPPNFGRGGDGPPREGGEGGPRPDGAPEGQGAGQAGGQQGNGQSGGNSSSGSAVAGGLGGGAARSSGSGGGGFGGPGGGGPGGGGPGGGGFGGGGRGPGGGGGRINFAIYHTVNLVDKVRLTSGMPEIDLLNGGTLGERAGQPRHQVEIQAGVSQAGFGARLTGQWDSATNVVGTTGTASSNLHFSDLATFNLRLFANLGQRPELVTKMPWLRGARLQFGINNILNTRQKVTDATGATPLAYRPGLVDPLGRTITLTLRKQLF